MSSIVFDTFMFRIISYIMYLYFIHNVLYIMFHNTLHMVLSIMLIMYMCNTETLKQDLTQQLKGSLFMSRIAKQSILV